MNRDFKGVWMPKEIWLHPMLSIQAKALWAELSSLYNPERGGCYASDEYLANFLGLKKSRLHEVFKELRTQHLLEKVSFDGRTRVLKALDPDPDTANREETGSQGSGIPESTSPESRNYTFI